MKEELERIIPELEEMRKRKSERRDQFIQVQEQIIIISNEIYGTIPAKTVADESDLSLRKLEELHRELQELQKEKVSYVLLLLILLLVLLLVSPISKISNWCSFLVITLVYSV